MAVNWTPENDVTPKTWHDALRKDLVTNEHHWDSERSTISFAADHIRLRHLSLSPNVPITRETKSRTTLPFNLRQTTRECVHVVSRSHFRSRDKDGGHTIRSNILHTNFTALFSIAPV